MTRIGYHLRPGALRAEARVLTPDGREAGVGRVEGIERLEPGEKGSDRKAATFAPPAGLQPGEYVLMVPVTDSAGGPETSVAPFAIAGARKG